MRNQVLSRVLLVEVLFAVAGVAVAVDRVSVQGLFSGAAVVLVDGQQRMLRVGQTSPEGVRLVSADSARAVVEVDGRQMTLQLGSEVHTDIAVPATREVRITRDTTGMYRTTGSINGQTVDFIVDTGATRVTLNAQEARRLGIDFRVKGDAAGVLTASGYEKGWHVLLDRVTVGAVAVRNVEAVVLEGPLPAEALLGNSFLSRLRLQDQGNLLILTQTH